MPPIAGLPNAKSAQCETSIVLDQHPKPKFQQQSQISTVNVELNTKCTNANCTNAQVHKCQMLKCTNAQMLKCQMSSAKCTNAQMHECTKAQMLNAQIPNTKYQMHKCTNAQMHKCTNAQTQMHKYLPDKRSKSSHEFHGSEHSAGDSVVGIQLCSAGDGGDSASLSHCRANAITFNATQHACVHI